jgi:hypothetical protein
MQKQHLQICLAVVIGVLVLNACGSAPKNSTPTLTNLEAISTSAAQTAFVQLTELALTMPPTAITTNTPITTPTSTPTLPTQTPALSTVPNCANSTFISDVTIPDGKKMVVNQEFTKTWRVQNTGSCAWTTSFKLAFSYGEAMGGQSVALTDTVQVGQQVDLSVKLKVPNKTGKLTGVWVLLDGSGEHFGALLTVVINVSSLSPTPTGNLTETPSLTLTPAPGTTATATPTVTEPHVATATPSPTETLAVPTETTTETPTS